MDSRSIEQLIEAGLPGCTVRVSGEDGVHFQALVVSESFTGQRPLARHRQVYETLGTRMGNEIHALSLRTLTPEEWRAEGGPG